ncbi:restriction endonuclease subunit S [Prevotella copri]|uniref:Restriction endonuclease subunit S n=1 Tax=Segatella copri TaxID=165179 RepID=A0AA90UGV6_9BACT|nr:restriction endonuclease subunit S [Segatella copri]MQN13798.1 restriction endonuclease subunit S [Segatella copri]
MERYREYKDSGIYYIPLIPSSWNVLKGKILFKEEKRPIRQQDEIVTCFRDGQVTLRKNRRLEGFTNSLKEIGYQGIRKGDLVIHNMDAFAGAIGVSDSDGKGTPVYAVCTPIREDVNQYYYCFLLRFLAKIGFIQSLAKGIRERSSDFRYGDFKELLLPVPSRAEQDAIVSYLDAATSKIDKAIVMQQKMIDLLNERKQIIIQNAVTKGLDENVEMKNSGVEWIGMIPKHWEIKRLKYVMHSYGRIGFRGYGTDDIVDEGQGAITLSPSNIQDSSMDYSKKTYLSWKKYYESPEIMIKNGDVLMVKTGSSYGKCAVVKDLPMECTINPQLVVFKEHKEFSEFLAYSFQTTFAKCFINTSVIGGTIPTISQEKINNYIFPFPSKSEQQAIVAYLDKEMQRFDSAITNCQRQIAFLQERKQIIINEVVTGKVKVS